MTISDDIKVSDFGLTYELAVDEFERVDDDESNKNCEFKLTLLYAAPEVILDYSNPIAYQEPADIWYVLISQLCIYLYTGHWRVSSSK